MTEIEKKSLETQNKLYKEIEEADRMILHIIHDAVKGVIKDVICPKMYFEKDQKTVELTTDEFTEIRMLLEKLSKEEGLCGLNDWIKENYITPRNIKAEILSKLK